SSSRARGDIDSLIRRQGYVPDKPGVPGHGDPHSDGSGPGCGRVSAFAAASRRGSLRLDVK
ncbi:MAG: hypothetical protein MUQ10_01805, partial [Anaerolineae bacterium]|nr:hypothetical protein [Anaerolineae bacterium]